MQFKNQASSLLITSLVFLFTVVSCQEVPSKYSNASEPNPTGIPIPTSKTNITNQTDSTNTFTPIPELESYLETPIFGKDFKVIIDSPRQDFRHPLQNNQFMLRVKGRVEGTVGKVPADFKLRLFSNNITAFQADKPIDEWDISFKKEADIYQFKHSSILNFQQGVYYFTIEQTSPKERFYVGKISLL